MGKSKSPGESQTRPRYSAAGGKSDPGDAFILADLLRTDGHRFRPRRPPSDDTRALRALVRGRDDLVAQRVALANQLRALLERFWPGAAAIFADVDSPIALAFLSRYPTPHSAARLGEKRLAQFLGQHAYCGRRPAADLLARLRAAPASQVGEAEAEASGDVVRALVAVLTPLGAHLQQLSAAITAALPQHPDGPLVQSLPRSGAVNAAQILAELGDDRARFPTAEQFAAEGGLAPVTHASGKHHAVVFRWACNKRLRRALTTFADNSRHASQWAAGVYEHARARGCRHPMRSGSSPAPGLASSGAAGRTAPRTTSRAIAPPRPSPPRDVPKVDTGCLMRGSGYLRSWRWDSRRASTCPCRRRHCASARPLPRGRAR